MKKLIALAVTGIMLLSPFSTFADDDLEERVAALEERVAALEAQLGNNDVVSEDDQSSENSITADGFTLTYKSCEVTKDYKDQDCVLIHFDFYNNSDETTSAQMEHLVKAFQNGKELDVTTTNGESQAAKDWSTDIMPGYGPLEVAKTFLISDMSDISIQITSMSDFSLDPIMFTVSLQ